MNYIETIIKRCEKNPKLKDPLWGLTAFDKEHPRFIEELEEGLKKGDGGFEKLILEFYRQFPEVRGWEAKEKRKEKREEVMRK